MLLSHRLSTALVLRFRDIPLPELLGDGVRVVGEGVSAEAADDGEDVCTVAAGDGVSADVGGGGGGGGVLLSADARPDAAKATTGACGAGDDAGDAGLDGDTVSCRALPAASGAPPP